MASLYCHSLGLNPEFRLYFEVIGDLILLNKVSQPVSSKQSEECLSA